MAATQWAPVGPSLAPWPGPGDIPFLPLLALLGEGPTNLLGLALPDALLATQRCLAESPPAYRLPYLKAALDRGWVRAWEEEEGEDTSAVEGWPEHRAMALAALAGAAIPGTPDNWVFALTPAGGRVLEWGLALDWQTWVSPPWVAPAEWGDHPRLLVISGGSRAVLEVLARRLSHRLGYKQGHKQGPGTSVPEALSPRFNPGVCRPTYWKQLPNSWELHFPLPHRKNGPDSRLEALVAQVEGRWRDRRNGRLARCPMPQVPGYHRALLLRLGERPAAYLPCFALLAEQGALTVAEMEAELPRLSAIFHGGGNPGISVLWALGKTPPSVGLGLLRTLGAEVLGLSPPPALVQADTGALLQQWLFAYGALSDHCTLPGDEAIFQALRTWVGQGERSREVAIMAETLAHWC